MRLDLEGHAAKASRDTSRLRARTSSCAHIFVRAHLAGRRGRRRTAVTVVLPCGKDGVGGDDVRWNRNHLNSPCARGGRARDTFIDPHRKQERHRAVAETPAAARRHVDETCPISTEGWTRRVHFVREGRDEGSEA